MKATITGTERASIICHTEPKEEWLRDDATCPKCKKAIKRPPHASDGWFGGQY